MWVPFDKTRWDNVFLKYEKKKKTQPTWTRIFLSTFTKNGEVIYEGENGLLPHFYFLPFVENIFGFILLWLFQVYQLIDQAYITLQVSDLDFLHNAHVLFFALDQFFTVF